MQKRENFQNEAYKQLIGQCDFIKLSKPLDSSKIKPPRLLNKISLLFCLWLSGAVFGYAWAMIQ